MEPEQNIRPPCCLVASVQRGFAKNCGKGGGAAASVLLCPVRAKTVCERASVLCV